MKTFGSTEEIIAFYMPNYHQQLQDEKENPNNDPGIAGKILARKIINQVKKDFKRAIREAN